MAGNNLFYILALVFIFRDCNADFAVPDSPLADLVQRALHPLTQRCMERVNATESDLKHLRRDPPYPEKTACVITCLLEKIGVVKSDKYSKMGFLTAITPLVLTNRKKLDHMVDVADRCDEEVVVAENQSKCNVGNEIVSCIFKHAPELHVKV